MNKFLMFLMVLIFTCTSCAKINPPEVENGNIIIGESNVLIFLHQAVMKTYLLINYQTNIIKLILQMDQCHRQKILF